MLMTIQPSFFCLVGEHVSEGIVPPVWQTSGRSVRVLVFRIVVEDQHRQPRAPSPALVGSDFPTFQS
jgi:hypothetical protein